MTVVQPIAVDALAGAIGQMNLHGVPSPGLGFTQHQAVNSLTDSSKAPSQQPKADQQNDDEFDDVEEEISYKPYRPAKLAYGRDHPDPVVENATLAAVAPPDIRYNLVMPASIIAEGKLSNLQLEAIVYGSQRHMEDVPIATSDGNDAMSDVKAPVASRCGFLLGDSAGMGKGRTLAGFVVENISRGRKKHVWISVSNDLYQDALRDLQDLGMGKMYTKTCFNLSKFKVQDTINCDEGIIFVTYSMLVAKGRLEQLLEWCRGDEGEDQFDGLICLDECHKAKAIVLDGDGNAKKGSSQTAAKVVELQKRLPRARVVYCSATSVSEPKNLGFMNRLGLWGPGTEHGSFNKWLGTIERLGTGAIELNAMHLKSIGALQARQLSYETCDFAIIDVISDDAFSQVYHEATKIWIKLHAELLKSGAKTASFWAEHLRFFQYLSIASKVDTCINEAKKAINDGHCCVIGLQSTGEASSQRAAKEAGMDKEGGMAYRFVSAPGEGLKRLIRSIIPERDVQAWLNAVDNLQLPAGHLDRLFNELGGPDKVAELTGRKSRQVQYYDEKEGKLMVKYATRKVNNIEEKNMFQAGTKSIAILSEAASTGISLQADKRVANQRRRVHITLELPWSADKAIQQLGRTHRSNQSSGPMYKFIIGGVGGEARFASAVARRLNSLGALTQGDRRATGSANALGLGNFDIDNIYGYKALQKMLGTIRKVSKNDTLDSLNDLNPFYIDAIKRIDSYLLRAMDSYGNWSDAIIPLDGTSPSDVAVRNILFRRRALTNSRKVAIKDAIKNGQTATKPGDTDIATAK